MKLKVNHSDFELADNTILLNSDDYQKLSVLPGSRVRVISKVNSITMFASITNTTLKSGVCLLSNNDIKKLGVENDDEIEVIILPIPKSLDYIMKKINGLRLTAEEIGIVIDDMVKERLSQTEIESWLSALQTKGMDVKEIADMILHLVNTGVKIDFGGKEVYDYHSIGGVSGNKVTPIIVSIVAAAGLMIPKISTRAISSACGTSDFVEVFCNVLLPSERVKSISESIGGVMSCTSAVGIAPIDSAILDLEYQLAINPRPQMLGSIMVKKVGIGVTNLLIDIPLGAGTKVPTKETAEEYIRDFTELGKRFGIKVKCAITNAEQPIGNAVGPKLEARECLRVLEGSQAYPSVADKACYLAGIILEMSGIRNGEETAKKILSSGDALKKFRQIVKAQDGNPDIKSEDIEPGKYVERIESDVSGYVHTIDNKSISRIARAAGSPIDKGAGLILLKKNGEKVKKGDTIIEIYADDEKKCKSAKELAYSLKPINVEEKSI